MNLFNFSLIAILCAGTFSFTTHSSGFSEKAQALRIQKWHDAYGPGFQIMNKGNVIWVAVAMDDKLRGFDEIQGSGKQTTVITGDEVMVIGVYTKRPTIEPKGFVLGKFVGSQPDHTFTIKAPQKTKYLTWNPAKFEEPAKYMYPQTGKFGGKLGFLSKSESGYDLSANISQSSLVYK